MRIFPILPGKAWLLGCGRILYIEQVNQGKDDFSSVTTTSFDLHLQVKETKQFTLLLTSYFLPKKASHFNYTMPKTLLTGANGFVAAHIIDQLITQGHTVTGSIRSPSKGQQILSTHPSYAGKLDFVIVSDYAASGTWDEIIKDGDFDYVIHSAAPLLDDERNKDFEKDFLQPSVNG